jgi:hypothetical protein
LSDGGVWNNLGTQVLLEDAFFQGHQVKNNKGRPSIVFAVNASGGLQPEQGAQYCIPGWAELKSVFRIMLIQNLNTVGPRMDSFERMRERDWEEDRPLSHRSPWVIDVAISRSPESQLLRWDNFFASRPRAPDPKRDVEAKRIEDLLDRPEFAQLCKLAQGKLEAVSTTLDRIPRETAMALVARGYLNTFAGAYVFGCCDIDSRKLSRLTPERLEFLTSRIPC